jgi:hypothetical protein
LVKPSIDENTTIDPIANAITSIEAMLYILQRRPSEGTLSFETFDQLIRNISKDIDATVEILNTKAKRTIGKT